MLLVVCVRCVDVVVIWLMYVGCCCGLLLVVCCVGCWLLLLLIGSCGLAAVAGCCWLRVLCVLLVAVVVNWLMYAGCCC